MKILLVTDHSKSSELVVRDIFFAADVKHDVRKSSPLKATADLENYEPDFIIIESFNNPDFSKNVVVQMRAASKDTPIFVLHHGEFNSDDVNASIESEYRALGAKGFANAQSDFDQVGLRLLNTAGIEPKTELASVRKRNVLVGDIRFDLVDGAAYSFMDEGTYDDYDARGDFNSFAHTSQRMIFNARSGGKKQSSDHTQGKLFDLSDEEVTLLHVLSLKQGEFILRKDIIRNMQSDQRLVPELESLDLAVASLASKLSEHRENYGNFIIHRNNRYCLNDIEMFLQSMNDDFPDPDLDLPNTDTDMPDLRAVLAEQYGDSVEHPIRYDVYAPSKQRLVIGPHLRINTTTNTAHVAGQRTNKITLEDEDVAVIDVMLGTGQKIQNTQAIIDDVYLGSTKPSSQYMRRLINSLNAKISALGFKNPIIKSVARKGFQINDAFFEPNAPAPKPNS